MLSLAACQVVSTRSRINYQQRALFLYSFFKSYIKTLYMNIFHSVMPIMCVYRPMYTYILFYFIQFVVAQHSVNFGQYTGNKK